MNSKNIKVIDVAFNEAETERVLVCKPYKDVSKELKKKIDLLKLDSWASIPRNLRVMMVAIDEGHIPSL